MPLSCLLLLIFESKVEICWICGSNPIMQVLVYSSDGCCGDFLKALWFLASWLSHWEDVKLTKDLGIVDSDSPFMTESKPKWKG
ncbi:hypothetical protein Dimus_034222 [Dionaea muscipula]